MTLWLSANTAVFGVLVPAGWAAGTGRYAGTELPVLVLLVCNSDMVVCFGVHGCIISHMYTPHFTDDD
eukprot:SAG31_NODE_11499_length_1023_cov_1.501082_1_plen_68_part_00